MTLMPSRRRRLTCRPLAIDLDRLTTVKIYRNGHLIHRTPGMCEEDVHDYCHRDAAEIHAQRRSDEHATPHAGLRLLDLLNAVLGEGMRQVDQQYKAKKQEQYGAHERDVITPDFEEAVGYKEGGHDQAQPDDDFGSPESILNRRALVSRVVDPQKQNRHDEME